MTLSSSNATRAIGPRADEYVPDVPIVDGSRLVAAYYDDLPQTDLPMQRVRFGPSGHRGSSLDRSFNEGHVLAIAQAICRYRERMGVDGPLFLGMGAHALSGVATATALEVFAANGIDVMLAVGDAFTPTPAVSHAIIGYNRGRSEGFADGIVMTPSRDANGDGGLKYNPLHGGPAGFEASQWIGNAANGFLDRRLESVKRIAHERALRASTTHRFDFLDAYVADLCRVVDMEAIGNSRIRLGVDAVEGAGVDYWLVIADRYRLQLTIVEGTRDPMSSDDDGATRPDPSMPSVRHLSLLGEGDFDVAFACDADHARHAIVTRGRGLLPPDHYLSVAADYLFGNRPQWGAGAGVGRSVVTTRMLDLVARRHHRDAREMPVGFEWFVGGLQDGMIGVACEAGDGANDDPSGGATFLRRDGRVWTTDQDGIVAALLAAEITVRTGHDPAALYAKLDTEFGNPSIERFALRAERKQMDELASALASGVKLDKLAGEPVESVSSVASGNGEPFGGIKISSASGWFVALPSPTESICRFHAESFGGVEHLRRVIVDGRAAIEQVLGSAGLRVVP